MSLSLWVVFCLLTQASEANPAETLLARHQAQLDQAQTLEARIETWKSRDQGRTWTRLSKDEWLKSGSSERQISRGMGFVDPGGTFQERETWRDTAHQVGETRELQGWNPDAASRGTPDASNQYHGAAAVIAGTTNASSISGESPYLMMRAVTPADDLPNLYRMAVEPDVPREVDRDGRTLWMFHLRDERFPNRPWYTVFLDPAKGYAITRRELEFERPNGLPPIRAIHEVTEFHEPEPGLFLPKVVRMIDLAKPDEIVEQRVEIVSVNRPIDESRLRLAFPAGMKVDDLKNGGVHIWGDDDRPRLTFRDESELRAHEASALTRSRSHKNATSWVLMGGALVLLVVVWIARRRLLARPA